jgi:Fanconi anemia group M protein
MLAIERQRVLPGEKVLFLAPTRPLAEQHYKYFEKNLPQLFATMFLFTGKTPSEQREKLWQSGDIIFSTPQCIANDLKHNLYDLHDVSLLIVDECHRCLKNYVYTYVAKKYHEQARHPRILGLTASPGSEKAIIQKVCENLGIETVEIRNRESEDVKPYIQELDFNIIKLDFPPAFQEIRNMLKVIFDKKVEELKNRKLLFMPPTKKFLLECQHRIMKAISSGNKHFNLLVGASACASAIKIQHALELLETQTLYSLQNYMHELFQQASQGKSKAVQQLVKAPEFNHAFIAIQELVSRKIENPKLIELKDLIEQEIKDNPKAKIIVFAQFRDTTTKIAKTLNELKGVNAKVFVGQGKKSTGKGEETGLSQKEQQQLITEFSRGKINVLAATSIAEEGLDIPELDVVIFYEPIPSAIRKIQRAGRTARLMPGKLIMLMIKGTRDEAYHWSAFQKEKRMYKAIDSIQEDLNNNPDYFKEQKQQKDLFDYQQENNEESEDEDENYLNDS